MSIERDGDQIEIACDDCPAGLGKTYERDEFDVMVEDAKALGWRISRVDGRWRHRCPKCSRDGRG